MPSTVSPKGEVTFINMSSVVFTWNVAWNRNQAVYEFAWKRASEAAWNSSGNINQSAASTGQGTHSMPAFSFVPNVRYTWKVRLRSATGSEFYRSGWSDIGMFVLTNTQMGLLKMATGGTTRQLRSTLDGVDLNRSRIQEETQGRLNEVAKAAENASEVTLIDNPADPQLGKRWEIGQGESQGPGGSGYNNYSDHSDTAYSQYYNYYNYYNYYDYYNYVVYSRYINYNDWRDYYNQSYCDSYSDCDGDCCDGCFCEFSCDSVSSC